MKKNIFFILIIFSFSTAFGTQQGLIPLPQVMKEIHGRFEFNAETRIICSDKWLETEADKLIAFLQPAMGFSFQENNQGKGSKIVLTQLADTTETEQEGYILQVNTGSIEISASTPAGFYYAFQTLLQLLPPQIYQSTPTNNIRWSIDGIYIKDKPAYSWRGVMLDVSRQFYDIDFLKKYINGMAAHKLNIFHLHLTDDEGWRIEIKALPELTRIGAWRGPNEALPPNHGSGDKRYGGFYTQEELKELVQYATERHIRILPEIDIPGHSRSVAVSYPEVLCLGNDTTASVQGVRNNVWCAGQETNFEMLDKIIAEVAAIFPIEYIHIGGDEVNHRSWEQCSRCQNLMKNQSFTETEQIQGYFIKRMENILAKYGKKMIGWNEITNGNNLHPETTFMAWTSIKAGTDALQQGKKVILSPASYTYLDMAQGTGERGHNWSTLLPLERVYDLPIPSDKIAKENLLGIQGNLWSEYLDQPDRQTEYQSYPRICAIAELGWTGKKVSYHNFEERLHQTHIDRLFFQGIAFRVAPPVIKKINGKLVSMTNIPNTAIYYSTDGAVPTIKSGIFKNGMKADQDTYLFRSCYRNTFFSPVSKLTYDTISFWNNSILTNIQSDTLILHIDQTVLSDKNPKTVLFRYLCGEDDMIINKIEIFKGKTSVYKEIREKPVTLSARESEWKMDIPKNLFNGNEQYFFKLGLTKQIPKDSQGVLLCIE